MKLRPCTICLRAQDYADPGLHEVITAGIFGRWNGPQLLFCTAAILGSRLPKWVNHVILCLNQVLPVHPHERTSSNLIDNRVGAVQPRPSLGTVRYQVVVNTPSNFTRPARVATDALSLPGCKADCCRSKNEDLVARAASILDLSVCALKGLTM